MLPDLPAGKLRAGLPAGYKFKPYGLSARKTRIIFIFNFKGKVLKTKYCSGKLRFRNHQATEALPHPQVECSGRVSVGGDSFRPGNAGGQEDMGWFLLKPGIC